MNKAVIIFVVAGVIGVGVYFATSRYSTLNPLAKLDVSEVASVKILNTNLTTGPPVLEVSSQRWRATLDCFQSTLVDWSPAKWKLMGTFEIELKDGQTISVDAYDSGLDPGRFKIGESYFIGGNDMQLDRLIDEARESAIIRQSEAEREAERKSPREGKENSNPSTPTGG